MDHDQYLDVIAVETAQLVRVAVTAPAAAEVPSCPTWRAADLLWHVAEVQYFWARIAGGVEDPDHVPDLARPGDAALLPQLLEEQTLALLHALRRRDPDEWCWSWADEGQSVGWVARRQAHEALIHRVDAELVAGAQVADVTPALAADGVDELVRVFLDGVPDWGAFSADGRSARLVADDTGDAWSLRFGRFAGTSPYSGVAYDEDTVAVVADIPAAEVTVTGPAWDLDRWLWGRADAAALAIDGDTALAQRLRDIAQIE
ncbi:maleylpyruvate isomerase N-terminal domain-containing protein [Egicoccus sp. AB-alg2]|uniref:maleylpyruvate isomerase N-terminal domain-containing protein n=1 Tax=Egicoccus sp. AB-alg2 TaxID=3242693 RepID=UPI00359E6ECF